MRKLLILALILYNIVARATQTSNNYDYDDIEGNKRIIDERKNWRKKVLLKTELNKEWDNKRQEYDPTRFLEESDTKPFIVPERQKELDMSAGFRVPSRLYEDEKLNMPSGTKSSELSHSSTFIDKEVEKKSTVTMNCERPHERYEACFAGCASVSCDNPRDRLRPCYPFCEPGCVCVNPYVRDDRTHKCVLPEECTKGLKGIPDLAEDI